ncbi:MAG: hypothetical protein LBN95_05430 [Prevotellaceae bacterium]|nr:hypothetical protein [Prevotellaceae bacterium]
MLFLKIPANAGLTGIKICNCLKSNSESTCLSSLNIGIGDTYTNSEEFMTGLNDNPCGYDFYVVFK